MKSRSPGVCSGIWAWSTAPDGPDKDAVIRCFAPIVARERLRGEGMERMGAGDQPCQAKASFPAGPKLESVKITPRFLWTRPGPPWKRLPQKMCSHPTLTNL